FKIDDAPAAGSDKLGFDRLGSDAGVIRMTACENHFVSISPNCEHVLGWKPEQLLSFTFSELVHPDDLEAALAEAATVDVPGRTVNGFEGWFRCADGPYKQLRIHAGTDGELWRAGGIETLGNRGD